TLEIVGPGGFAGGFLLGLYLYLAHKLFPGVHTNEVLLCQRREDYKHVLRLHIDREGGLTIHPIGMEHAPTSWTYRPAAGPGEAWFEPSAAPITQRVALIEPPIRLSPKAPGGRWTPQR